MKISSLVVFLVTKGVSAWTTPQIWNDKSSCPAASSPLFKKVETFQVDPSEVDEKPTATLVTSKLYTVLSATKEELVQSAQNIYGSSIEIQSMRVFAPRSGFMPRSDMPRDEQLEPTEYTVMTSSGDYMDHDAIMFGAWPEKIEIRGVDNPNINNVKYAILISEDILFLPITKFSIEASEADLMQAYHNYYTHNVKKLATIDKHHGVVKTPALKFNLDGFLGDYTAKRKTKEVIIVEWGDALEQFLQKDNPRMLPGATLLHTTFRPVYKSDLRTLQLTGKENLKKLQCHKGVWRTGTYEVGEGGSHSIRQDDESGNINALGSVRRSNFSEIHFDNGGHVSYYITKWRRHQMNPLAFKIDRVNDPHGA